MHITHVEDAKQQFQALEKGLFECCYVSSSHAEATYALSWSGAVDFNDVIWFRTVDILTGEIKREGCAINQNENYALVEAIKAHYTPEYIKRDGIILACEFASECVSYIHDGKNTMHYHIVFGQSVHYQDVDELSGKTYCGQEFYI